MPDSKNEQRNTQGHADVPIVASRFWMELTRGLKHRRRLFPQSHDGMPQLLLRTRCLEVIRWAAVKAFVIIIQNRRSPGDLRDARLENLDGIGRSRRAARTATVEELPKDAVCTLKESLPPHDLLTRSGSLPTRGPFLPPIIDELIQLKCTFAQINLKHPQQPDSLHVPRHRHRKLILQVQDSVGQAQIPETPQTKSNIPKFSQQRQGEVVQSSRSAPEEADAPQLINSINPQPRHHAFLESTISFLKAQCGQVDDASLTQGFQSFSFQLLYGDLLLLALVRRQLKVPSRNRLVVGILRLQVHGLQSGLVAGQKIPPDGLLVDLSRRLQSLDLCHGRPGGRGQLLDFLKDGL